MFGLGTSEILIILVVALVVIGPRNLPKVARSLGRLFGQVQRMSGDLSDAIRREATDVERGEKDATVVTATPVTPGGSNQDAAPINEGMLPYEEEDSDSATRVLHDRPGPPDPQDVAPAAPPADSDDKERD